MKFKCQEEKCGKQFIYPATHTITNDVDNEVEATETRTCPYCGSLNFDEVKEELVIEKTVSVKDVPLAEVDDWLQKGYEVSNLYSKNAVLVKKESITVLEEAQ